MEFKELSMESLKDAAKLLAQRHVNERKIYPFLNSEFEDPENTFYVLQEYYNSEYVISIGAYSDDKLKGFILSNIYFDPNLGRCAYINYECMAISDDENPELYRLMYTEIASLWVKYGVLDHYVMVPTGEFEVVSTWLNLSFSFQQAYGINELKIYPIDIPTEMIIKKASPDDQEALKQVSGLIYQSQAVSPSFTTAKPEKIAQLEEGYMSLANDETSVTLLAYENNEIRGFQSACFEDQSVMILPSKCMEISISGTLQEYQRKGIGTLLTRMMGNISIERGYHYAMADWRVANLHSSNFWKKMGFKVIAYRMHRKIDNDIFWANGQNSLRK